MEQSSLKQISNIAYRVCLVSTAEWLVFGIALVWSRAPSAEWFLTFFAISVASAFVLGATHYVSSSA